KNEGSRIELQIFDMAGRNMGSWETSANDKYWIDISQMPDGLYTLSITDGTSSTRQKIIIVR
ncbi:MAG: T9SS type A sorting domain-containing protein, partial [Bacteroidetes bacterium]|nr:T9SS type A sorting domain-containing protein [Bacteroidota bacterium]